MQRIVRGTIIPLWEVRVLSNVLLRCGCVQGVRNVWEASLISTSSIVGAINDSHALFWVDYRNRKVYDIDAAMFYKDCSYIKSIIKDPDMALFDNPHDKKAKELPPGDLSVMLGLFDDPHIPLDIRLLSVRNSFQLYTHDDGFYSCFYSHKLSNITVLRQLLKQIIYGEKGIRPEMKDDSQIGELLERVYGGVAIDVESICVESQHTFLKIHCYNDGQSRFSNFLFPRESVSGYEMVRL